MEDGDAAGLGGADEGGLVGSGGVGVDDGDTAEGSHSGGHGGFGDSVHRGGDEGSGERDVAGEVGGEVDGVGGEVDVVREEDDVVVGVGEALVEELLRRETVLDWRRSEVHLRRRRWL